MGGVFVCAASPRTQKHLIYPFWPGLADKKYPLIYFRGYL